MEINKLLKKVFGSASHDLYVGLFSILSVVASEKDYLENLSVHADAIHWHLNRVSIFDFEKYLLDYFLLFLKNLRKSVSWNKICVAFDETFIPYYGKIDDNWVCGYTNNVKGATGSFKFMVCSIVVNKKRFILGILPMHNNQDANKTVYNILDLVKSKFNVETVLFDRGFCNKKICRELERKQVKYLVFSPKRSNIKKFLKAQKTEVIVKTKISENMSRTNYKWRFVFAYNQYGHDWVFATNLTQNPTDLVKLYKARWGIETNFRIMDFANIKSKSKNIVTRCFFFLISAILFNQWLKLDKKITFETYLDCLELTSKPLRELLEQFKQAKRILGIKITQSEEKILSSKHKLLTITY